MLDLPTATLEEIMAEELVVAQEVSRLLVEPHPVELVVLA
jgi:hypothetical protein